MTHQEKMILSSLFSTCVVFAIYASYMMPLQSSGRFLQPDGTMFIGRSVLILIGVSIVASIAVSILFSILHAIVTNTPKPDFTTDERDRMIELRGMQVFGIVAGIGFVGSMIIMASGGTMFWVIHAIIFGFGIGDVIANIARLSFYRRGY